MCCYGQCTETDSTYKYKYKAHRHTIFCTLWMDQNMTSSDFNKLIHPLAWLTTSQNLLLVLSFTGITHVPPTYSPVYDSMTQMYNNRNNIDKYVPTSFTTSTLAKVERIWTPNHDNITQPVGTYTMAWWRLQFTLDSINCGGYRFDLSIFFLLFFGWLLSTNLSLLCVEVDMTREPPQTVEGMNGTSCTSLDRGYHHRGQRKRCSTYSSSTLLFLLFHAITSPLVHSFFVIAYKE
jgi:hypothetical protein